MTTFRFSDDQWLLWPRPNPGARLRLFCFPYAGSGAFVFRTWPDRLPALVEVCGVQLPGRENRCTQPAFTRLMPLVQALLTSLYPHLDRPFAFFGHSMGAIIAFELARSLRRHYGLTPAYLAVAARVAPQVRERRDPPLHRLPEAALLERLRAFHGTPEAVLGNAEMMRFLLPLLRADFEVNETYVYTPDEPFTCPLTAFRGADDALMTYDEVDAWREHTTGTYTLHTVPGGHFFWQNDHPRFWQILVHEVGQALQRLASLERSRPA